MIRLDLQLLGLLDLPDSSVSSFLSGVGHTVRSKGRSGGSAEDSAMEIRSEDAELARFLLLHYQSPSTIGTRRADSLSSKTKFRPEVQLDDFLRNPKLFPINDQIFIFHNRSNRFIGNNSNISIIRFTLRRDIYRFESFSDRTSFLLSSQPRPCPYYPQKQKER